MTIPRIDNSLARDMYRVMDIYEVKREMMRSIDIYLFDKITADTSTLYEALTQLLSMEHNQRQSQLVLNLTTCAENAIGSGHMPDSPIILLQQLAENATLWAEQYQNKSQPIYQYVYEDEEVVWRDKLNGCVEIIKSHKRLVENITGTLLGLIEQYNSTENNCTLQLVHATEMETHWLTLPNIINNLQRTLSTACTVTSLEEDHFTSLNIPEEYDMQQQPFYQYTDVLGNNFLLPFMMREPTIREELISPFMHYLNNITATKTQLFLDVSSDSYNFIVVTFLRLVFEISVSITESNLYLTEFLNGLKKVFSVFYSLPIPVMTNATINTNLSSINFFAETFKHEEEIVNLTQAVHTQGLNGSVVFNELMTVLNRFYVDGSTRAKNQLERLKDSFLREMNRATAKLSSFDNLESQIMRT